MATTVRTRTILAAAAGVAVLQACVYLPRVVEHYDAQCRTVHRHLVLEGVQVAALAGCANEACLAFVVGAGVVTAASVVVSGTLVMAGNVVYWAERRSTCPEVP